MLRYTKYAKYLIKLINCSVVQYTHDLIIIVPFWISFAHVVNLLLSHTMFNLLVDITGLDLISLKVVVNLISIYLFLRIQILSSFVSALSISEIFIGAAPYEREVWDMYGIKFYNHPDMRRILSDYGSVGNPLLKKLSCFRIHRVTIRRK